MVSKEPLALDLEFRHWDHGDAPPDPQLPLAHAAALLSSALPHTLDARSSAMNPRRFVWAG